jgi:hypothetical protein
VIALVVLDRLRWGRIETGFSWDHDSDPVVRTGAELPRQGVPVRLKIDCTGWPSLRHYNGDARRVRRALAHVGYPLPRR